MNHLDAEKLGKLALAVGTAAYRRTYRARGWHFPPAKCTDLRDLAVAAALEVLTAHNGRRGRLSTRQAAVAAASRAAENALRREADGRKASTLVLGSMAVPGDLKRDEPLPAVESEGEKDGNTRLTASDASSGRQTGGKDTAVISRSEREMSRERAAHEVAFNRLPVELQDVLEDEPERHLTGKNAANAAAQRAAYETARTVYRVLLDEAREDEAAIAAMQARARGDIDRDDDMRDPTEEEERIWEQDRRWRRRAAERAVETPAEREAAIAFDRALRAIIRAHNMSPAERLKRRIQGLENLEGLAASARNKGED